MTPACSSWGCPTPGHWIPVLVIPQPDGHVNQAEMDFPLCGRHKAELTLEAFLTTEVWTHLSNSFQKVGHPMPPREQVDLDFKHIEHGYCC